MKFYIDADTEISWTGEFPKKKKEALEASIQKWEIVKKYHADTKNDLQLRVGSDNCPLCELYVNRTGSCKDCPVYKHTGEEECINTSFYKYVNGYYWETLYKVANEMVKLLKGIYKKEYKASYHSNDR